MRTEHFSNFQLSFNSLDIQLVEHGYFWRDPSWNKSNITSPFNRLYFVLEGGAFIQNSNDPSDITVFESNKIYLIPLNTTHNYVYGGLFEKFYLHFQLEYSPGHDLFENIQNCMHIDIGKEQLLRIIQLAQSNDFFEKLLFKSKIFEILSAFAVHTNIEYREVALHTQYKAVFDLIEENFKFGLGLDYISEALGLNKHTLRKKFKTDLGITLNEYINLRIVERAKSLLLKTDLTLKEISFELGFSDEFYFSRFFKRYIGCPPRQFRINSSVFYGKDML